MKKITLLLFISISFSSFTHAQLMGIKTIPGDYATVALAVAALNTNGVGAGGVTFNVAAGHTETGNIVLTATGIAGNPIIFQKSGVGTNPTITAGTGTFLDAIFAMQGSDYVTLDGLTFLENPTNTTYQENTEYGIAFRKPNNNNGCQFNTIQNCTISLNRTYTYEHPTYFRIFQAYGIHFNHGTDATQFGFLTTSTLGSGSSSNNLIQNNTITNATFGIWLRSNQNATSIDLIEHDNQILNNTISNIGGHGFGAGCIYLTTSANNIITGNNLSTHISHSGALYGVKYDPHGKSGVTITNNSIQINSNNIGGPAYVQYGIEITGAGGTDAANAFGNLILVKDNTISSNIRSHFAGIDVKYVDNVNVISNTIHLSSNIANITDATGINITSQFNTNPTQIIRKNIIDNNASTLNQVTGISTSGVSISNTIDSNKIINNNGFQVTGIFSFLENATVTNNVVACGASNVVERFQGVGFASNGLLFANNYIGCTAGSPSNTTIHYGMNIFGNATLAPRQIFHNTIYLAGGATGAGAQNNSAALNYNGTFPNHLVNNIFVNNMLSGNAGKVFAFLNATPVATSAFYAVNNLFYAGIPSSKQLIYGSGSILTPTYVDSTLELYKLRVCALDVKSVTDNPTFISLDYNSPNYLHIDSTVATLVNNMGSNFAGTVVDYDGELRNITTPDIGADELNGIAGMLTSPLTPPVLWFKADAGAYTNAGTTLATNNQTIQQWNDQSCSKLNASQSNIANRPTYKASAFNGKPAIYFDGSNGNYFLNSTFNAPVLSGAERTVFVYGKRDCKTHTSGVVGGTLLTFRRSALVNTLTYGANSIGAPVFIYSDGNGVGNNNASIPGGAMDTAQKQFLVTYKVPAAGSQIVCYVNGIAQAVNQGTGAVVAETGLGGFTIGDREDQTDLDWSGWIAEVIVYDRFLTEGERVGVENYLQNKYAPIGLPVQFTGLPISSPYSSNSVLEDATWMHPYSTIDNSKVITSINPNCLDLGTISAIAYTDGGAGLYNSQRYMRRHYVINTSLNPTGMKRVRIYYTNADFSDLQFYVPSLISHNELSVTKYDGPNEDGVYDPLGGTVTFIPSSQITAGAAFGQRYLEFDVDGFSEFWIHVGNTALPLDLLSFTGTKVNNTTVLHWETANMVNVLGFEIEKSIDAKTFTKIGFVAATEKNEYSFTDNKLIERTNYYRLKMIDIDGKYTYSRLALVLNTDKIDIIIYPNPIKNELNIVSSTSLYKYTIVDIYGKEILNGKSISSHTTLHFNSLAKGIYFLKIESADEIKTFKISKD